jgi:hypothetical protein
LYKGRQLRHSSPLIISRSNKHSAYSQINAHLSISNVLDRLHHLHTKAKNLQTQTLNQSNFKMQFTTALLTTIISTAAIAAPTNTVRNVPSLTFQLTNDLTGAHASATTLGDGLSRNLTDLFAGSAIADKNTGSIKATSAQLTHGFSDATRCFFQNVNDVINFDGRHTWVDLDGVSGAGEKEMRGFNVQCV